MEAQVGKFFESVSNFFSGGDHIPWCDSDVIAFLKEEKSTLCGYDLVTPIIAEITADDFYSYRRYCSLGCEREVAKVANGSSEEIMKECLMRLSWALVHSRRPEDVQRGIAMLETSLSGKNNALQMRENLYLLAVGFYRSGDYTRSRELVDQCLTIAPDWRQARTLKKTIEDKITKDGVIGIGIAATAVGLIAGGIAAAVARKR